MFPCRKSRRVRPLTEKSIGAVSFLSPHTTMTSDPADMFVAGKLKKDFVVDFNELLPPAFRSEANSHPDGSGDFKSTEAFPIQPKAGAGFKKLFKSRKGGHRHQQTVNVYEPRDEPEPTSADKKGKPKRGLLKWIHNKLKPRKKSFKSAHKDRQEKDVIVDNLPGHSESLGRSVETLEGISGTPGGDSLLQFRKKIFCSDKDPSFTQNKEQINSDPAVDADKDNISEDSHRESMLPSKRISANSAVTNQQSENKQDEHQEGPESTSSKVLGSSNEDSSPSDLLHDGLESSRQENTEGPPDQAGRFLPELSFKHVSDDFERSVYSRCLEIYMNAYQRHWQKMNLRASSQSATDGVTKPPTSSTKCWTKTAPENLFSQPEAPPRASNSRRVRPLTEKSIGAVSFLSPHTCMTSDPADMFVAGKLKKDFVVDFDELLPPAFRSEANSHPDGSGDFKSTEAFPIQPKAGAGFKKPFKSRKGGHRHQQTVNVYEPRDEPEPTSADKKGKPKRGLLKWIHNKLKPRKKSFKSAHKDRQEKDVIVDNLPGHSESLGRSVETLEGISGTPGGDSLLQFRKKIFCSDKDPSFTQNKEQINSDPAVDAEKDNISEDSHRESMLPSKRISANSAVTNQQSENKQDEHQEGPESTSSKVLGSSNEDSSPSDLLHDGLESSRQENTEGPPDQAGRFLPELSFKHVSDDFERSVYSRCLEIYMNAYQRHWQKMNSRASSQSATDGVTKPPTSSTKCWTKTAPENLFSQPEAPPRASNSRRVRPLTEKSIGAVSFLSPHTTMTSDPADMCVAGKLKKEFVVDFNELLPPAFRSEANSHLDGSGDFKSTEAFPIQPKAGAGFKKPFKSRKGGHRHQQTVNVCEPRDEPEPTSADKKGKPKRGLLKWIHNKLKPRKKSFKSAHKDRQEKDVIVDNLPGHSESLRRSVETLEGISGTPGGDSLLQFRKKIFCSDKDPSFTQNKEQINSDPAVDADKDNISEDSHRESMLPSKRISANSAVTNQQSENKQDEHQEGPESTSSKVLGSSNEDSSPSDLLHDGLESSRQENTEGPPDQAGRFLPELSFKHVSDDFERSVYSRCREIYMNAYQRHWQEMNSRASSQSATDGVTKPPTSSTKCWTKTAPENLFSQPEAPPRNVSSTRSRFKRFTNLVRKRLSRLFKIRIVITIYL